MTLTIPIGRPFTMASGTVYALPAAALQFLDQGAGTVQVSNDGTTWTNTSGNEIVGAFARSDGGDSIIILQHH